MSESKSYFCKVWWCLLKRDGIKDYCTIHNCQKDTCFQRRYHNEKLCYTHALNLPPNGIPRTF